MHAHGRPEQNDAEESLRRASRSAGKHAEAAEAASPHPGVLSPAMLVALQRSIGNTALANMMTGRHPVQRSTVPDVLRSSGRPLDEETRTEMETRLGADFSDVRLHHDETARRSAAEIGARAYTSGNHVVIGEGGGDKHTLAHELTHVIQQRHGPVAGADDGTGLAISDPADRFEREAEASATRAMTRPAPTSESAPHSHDHGGTAVQRAPAIQRAPSSQQTSARPSAAQHNAFVAVLERVFRDRGGWSITEKPGLYRNFLAHKADTAGGEGDKSIVEPRSYKNEPEVQALRWISTVVRLNLEYRGLDPQEVQSAVDNGTFYISTNNQAANSKLRELTAGYDDEINWVLFGMLQENRTEQKNQPVGDNIREKWRRRRFEQHQDKIDARLLNEGDARYLKIIDTYGRKMQVVSQGEEGLHAERRIAMATGGTPEFMAGTKRPCLSCYLALHADPTSTSAPRPGDFNSSGYSNIGAENYNPLANPDQYKALADSFYDEIEFAGITTTYRTLIWDCDKDTPFRPSRWGGGDPQELDFGSESDTDVEGNVRTGPAPGIRG